MPPARRLMLHRLHKVCRRVKAGTLPAPIYPALKSPRWRADEIDAVIARGSEAR